MTEDNLKIFHKLQHQVHKIIKGKLGYCSKFVISCNSAYRERCHHGISETCCSQGVEGYCKEEEGPCAADFECEAGLVCGLCGATKCCI